MYRGITMHLFIFLLGAILAQEDVEETSAPESPPSARDAETVALIDDLFSPPAEDLFKGDKKRLTIYPERQLSNWTICKIEDLICPKRAEGRGSFPLLSESVDIWPLKSMSSVVEGYLCKRLIMARTCWTNFLGAQTVNGSEHVLLPSYDACKLEVSRANKGIYQPPIWPEHVCAWMATKTVAIRQIELTTRSMIYEHLESSFFGAPLLNNVCRSPPCKTVVDRVLWIPSGPKKDILESSDLLKCKAGYNKTAGEVRMKCPHQPLLSFRIGACYFKYGTHTGLRSEEGIGMIWGGTSRGLMKILKGKSCKKEGKKIFQWSSHKEIDYSVAVAEDDEMHHRCLDAIARIRDSKKISQWDLGYFYPAIPGPTRAFRLSQETNALECAQYLFAEGNIGSSKELLAVIDPTSLGRSGPGGDKQGVNGIVVTQDNSVYIPNLISSRSINWGEHIHPEDLVEVKSHGPENGTGVISVEEFMDMSDLAAEEAKKESGWDGLWSNLTEKLVWAFSGLLMSFVLTGVCMLWGPKLLKLCCKRREPNFTSNSLFRH